MACVVRFDSSCGRWVSTKAPRESLVKTSSVDAYGSLAPAEALRALRVDAGSGNKQQSSVRIFRATARNSGGFSDGAQRSGASSSRVEGAQRSCRGETSPPRAHCDQARINALRPSMSVIACWTSTPTAVPLSNNVILTRSSGVVPRPSSGSIPLLQGT